MYVRGKIIIQMIFLGSNILWAWTDKITQQREEVLTTNVFLKCLSHLANDVARTTRDTDYYQAAVNWPLASCQCGVQARATSLTAMFALVGLIEIDSSFS